MSKPRVSTPSVTTALPPSMDPLAEPLRLLNLTGVLHCRAELTAPWGLDLPRIPGCIAIHVITSGDCVLEVAGQTRYAQTGDLLMLPHGTRHILRSDPDAPVTPLTKVPVQLITDRYERMNFGGGGVRTHVSYCGVRYDLLGAQRLLQVLPLVIHLEPAKEGDEWLQDTVKLLGREADATRPGSESIITSLTDIVFVQAIRAWLSRDNAQQGWLAALSDRFVGRALTLIHQQPGRAWTVTVLAQEIGLSRSAFSARFTELVGQSVMGYVREWRMQLARRELVENDSTLAMLAQKYGYGSEAAFSRAFKSTFEMSPSDAKRRAITH